MILKDGDKARQQAARLIAAGGVVAFRTDTFYGLGADPFNRAALRRLFALKEREENKPILVLMSDAAIVDRFNTERASLFEKIRARHWPGALTLVLPARADVPLELTAQTGTIGVRLPANESVRDFVRACGGALTATSANRSGDAPARTALEVARAFTQGLSLIVDGGEACATQPSTVLDVTGLAPRLIREGAVSWREIQETSREDAE